MTNYLNETFSLLVDEEVADYINNLSTDQTLEVSKDELLEGMRDYDRRILEQLENNPRSSDKEIANALSTDRAHINRKINQLKNYPPETEEGLKLVESERNAISGGGSHFEHYL